MKLINQYLTDTEAALLWPEDRVTNHVENKYVTEGTISAYLALKDMCTI